MIDEANLERVAIVAPEDRADQRLGRQLVHDRRSRAFPGERSGGPRRRIMHRTYNPRPTPDQVIGNCTGVDQAIRLNARGNRRRGEVLTMMDADAIYSGATARDPFPGVYPPEDTGSSGLAAGMEAIGLGLASRVEWYFGLEEVLDGLQVGPIGIGGWWRRAMWRPDPTTLLVPYDGNYDGGHQWAATGHDPNTGRVYGLCWWGRWPGLGPVFGRFAMLEDQLGALLDEGGDAHRTIAAAPNALVR